MKNFNLLLDQCGINPTGRFAIFEQVVGENTRNRALKRLTKTLDELFPDETQKEQKDVLLNNVLFNAYDILDSKVNDLSKESWHILLREVRTTTFGFDMYNKVFTSALDIVLARNNCLLHLSDTLGDGILKPLEYYFIALYTSYDLFSLFKPAVLSTKNISLYLNGVSTVEAYIYHVAQTRLENLKISTPNPVWYFIIYEILSGVATRLEEFSEEQLCDMFPQLVDGLALKILDEETKNVLENIMLIDHTGNTEKSIY